MVTPSSNAAFYKRPAVIIHFVEIVAAIIVFGCISDKVKNPTINGYATSGCLFDRSTSTDRCNFGIAVGVLMFIFAVVFVSLEVLRSTAIPSIPPLAVFDLGISTFLFLLALIAFSLLTNDWTSQTSKYRDNLPSENSNCAQASLAFLFFSFFLWAFSAFFAFRDWRKPSGGAEVTGPQGAAPSSSVDAQYASFVGDQ